jgi:dienelactone hydrolase
MTPDAIPGVPSPLLLIATLALTSAACAQEAARHPDPIGDEAYRVVKAVYDYDEGVPLRARVVAVEDLADCTREKIVYRVRDSWVVGYLGIPKTGAKPFPCVLALHGIGSDKAAWWEDDSFPRGGELTTALLRDGIAVFTPDAEYHGERSHANDFEPAGALVFEKGWVRRVRDMIVQSVTDCRRGIDYLATRPELDADRIGVIGYSMGGIEAFPLTALEPRVKVAVACVTSVSHIDAVDGGPLLAPRNFVRGIDRPFLMLMGRRDPACTVQDAQQVHDRIPAAEKEIEFYDSGHRLPREYVDRAHAWLRRVLQPTNR